MSRGTKHYFMEINMMFAIIFSVFTIKAGYGGFVLFWVLSSIIAYTVFEWEHRIETKKRRARKVQRLRKLREAS